MLSTQQSRPSEAAIMNNFVNNHQSTHTTAVINSVGMAILLLQKQYFKAGYTREIIERHYQACINDITRFADKQARKSALRFLNNKANEPINQLDNIHLYLPDTQGHYSTITHTITLRHVVPLVWMALRDHDKFSHNYNGTSAEQFSQARGDYNHRVSDFFNILIAINDDRLCHTGLRNELVFLLNKTYFGIEIIEDALSTIAATLKDQTNALFWLNYHNAATRDEKKKLTAALFTWMSDYNPQPLLLIVDAQRTIVEKLSALFMQHGSNPAEIGIEKHIQNCLPTLNFSYDAHQYPIINTIEAIFASLDETNDDTIQRALVTVKNWIITHGDIDDVTMTADFAGIQLLYQAQKSLDARMVSLLKATGDMHDDFHLLKNYCKDYFALLANQDRAAKLPQADSTMLTIAQRLTTSLINCKSNKMSDFIENFFARWIIAIRERNLSAQRYLYRFLLDNIFQEKVIIADAEIDVFWQQADAVFRDITVYQINRVFLHAHMIEKAAWSEKFETFIGRVYQFIVQELIQQNDLPQQKLLESSYTPAMLTSINTIITNTKDTADLLEEDILMPHHVKWVSQWIRLTKLIGPEKQLEIYEPQAVRINDMLSKAHAARVHSLAVILKTIPEKYRLSFLSKMDRKTITNIGNIHEITTSIDELIAPNQRLEAWQHFITKENINKIFKEMTDNGAWHKTVEHLEPQDRFPFIESFADFYTVIGVWSSNVCLLLPPIDLVKYYIKLRSLLTDKHLIKTLHEKLTLATLKQLDLNGKIKLLQAICTDFASDESNVYFTYPNAATKLLDEIIHLFEGNHIELLHHLVIVRLSVDLKKLSTDANYWKDIFMNLDMGNRLQFLQVCKDVPACSEGLDGHLKTLLFIADNLTMDFRRRYMTMPTGERTIKQHCQQLPKQHAVLLLLEKIPLDIRMNYSEIFKNADWEHHLLTILNLLPAKKRFEYFESKYMSNNFTQLCINKKVNLLPVLVSLIQIDINLFFVKFGDKLLRLVAAGAIKNSDLDSLFHANENLLFVIQNTFVAVFSAIYNALWQGQSSFFISSHWVKNNLSNVTSRYAIDLIFQHAQIPGSRTEKALSLMKKSHDYSTTNHALLEEIYIYSFSKSGLLKRSSRYVTTFGTQGYFFKTASVENTSSLARFERMPDNLSSRRSKILAAMQAVNHKFVATAEPHKSYPARRGSNANQTKRHDHYTSLNE